MIMITITFKKYLNENAFDNKYKSIKLTDDLESELKYWLNKKEINKNGCGEILSIYARGHGDDARMEIAFYTDDEKKATIDVTFNLEHDGTVTDLKEFD